jgi:hypothetical protein
MVLTDVVVAGDVNLLEMSFLDQGPIPYFALDPDKPHGIYWSELDN